MNRIIIIEEELLEGIQENIDILINDWKIEGADEVFVRTHPKGVELNPNGIRTILQSIDNLEGALLIGELPIARIREDSTSIPWFATDYFFMELNETWNDEGENYVSCENYMPPTIFIGRLVVGSMTGYTLGDEKPTEIEFYNQYLEKLHQFRLYARQYSLRIGSDYTSIIYDEARNEFKACLVNNWGADTQVIAEWLTHLYPIENISVYEDVNRDEYWNILSNNKFDFLAFRSHSDGGQHTLEDGTYWNAVEYINVKADVNFFELTACGTGSMVWEQSEDPYDPASPKILKLVSDVLAWNIQFAETGGLIVIAPSISGAMNFTTVMYDNLRNGGTFGRAFRLWCEYMASSEGSYPAGWAFNLFFGDPFIRFDLPNFKCVIYTSLIGTKQEYKLHIMRIWRDIIFNQNKIGRFFVSFFYKTSPFFSKIIVKSRILRKLNRWFFVSILKLFELTPWNRKVKKYIAEKEQAKKQKLATPRLTECKICKKGKM